MKTLKLFNAVLKDTNKKQNGAPFVSDHGFVIEAGARYLQTQILSYYDKERLSGNELNKTFHKSWQKIKDSSRFELYVEQILHYFSTYGSNFTADMYLPNEVLELPDVKLKYKVIRALTADELIKKCLSMLQSGLALTQDTISDLFEVLQDLDYVFTGNENVKNNEAIAMIADLYNIYPKNPVDFFRYIMYRTTDDTLLIKSDAKIQEIKDSRYNPSVAFKAFGLKELSTIFNRFKPLFLAYKGKCKSTINKIGKLSKKNHVPLATNVLSLVTQRRILKTDIHWLKNATVYALFKALNSCYTRLQGQNCFVYKIRNGKAWVKTDSSVDTNYALCGQLSELFGAQKSGGKVSIDSVLSFNFQVILEYIRRSLSLKDTTIYIPENVEYALPTSEKMYVGNIPTGTKFFGEKLAVGIYWKNSGGASDLDLSGMNIGGKVGWNSSYSQGRGDLMYSGDLTDASNGAVEYLYANKGLTTPTLVLNNVYSGDDTCEYKIIVGEGADISRDYMMNPDNLFMEATTNSVQNQTVLGLFNPEGDCQSFVLLNFGSGNCRVSGNSETTDIATKALYQQWNNPLTLKQVCTHLGAEFVSEVDEADVDLSLDSLEKDTFVSLFAQNR